MKILVRAGLLGALCVLSASRWLLEDARPEVASTAVSRVLGAVLCAVLLAGFTGLPGWVNALLRHSSPRRWAVPGWALCLTGPALARLVAGRNLSADHATLAMALVPVVIAVCTQAAANEDTSDLPGQLWPGLAGVAGLLLLLPEPHLTEVRAWLGLLALPFFVGVGASLAVGQQPGRVELASSRWATTWGVLLAAVSFAVTSALLDAKWWHVAMTPGAVGLDGCLLGLSVLSLLAVGPRRWSAQFLLVPLLALLDGLVLLRPLVDLRSIIGLLLLAAGSARLLWPSREIGAQDTTELSLH